MKNPAITLLAALTACAVPAMAAAHPAPPQPETTPIDSVWIKLEEATEQAAIRLNEAMEVVSPFMDFDNKTLDQKREAIGNYASFLAKTFQEERDSYSQRQIEEEVPDTINYYFEKGSDIHWGKLRVPSEGMDTQPLIDEYIGTFSEIGPFYFQCPEYDLWERLDMEDHRRELFDRIFDPGGTYILGCVLRNGEFIDMQEFESGQKWDYAEEHQAEIDSVRLQFTFADPGKIRMIALDTQNDRATVGDRDFTLQSDGMDGVQLTIEKHNRKPEAPGDRFIEAVNTLENGQKTSSPDMGILYPKTQEYTRKFTSAMEILGECITEAATVNEEGIEPLLEKIKNGSNPYKLAPHTYSKEIRVYRESQGRIEIFYIGQSQPRQVTVTKVVERQE